MSSILVDREVEQQLRLLARAWGSSTGEAVRRVLAAFGSVCCNPTDAHDGDAVRDAIPIHAGYQGIRIDAAFDAQTQGVKVLSGPLAGHTYKSPSGAAVAVVRTVNPAIHPNRNGWGFWLVSDTGAELESLRKRG